MAALSTRLKHRAPVGGNVFDFDFAVENPRDWRFRAGQFVTFAVGLDPGGQPVRRSYSVASPSDEPDHIRLLVKVLPAGPAAGFFLDLAPGAPVEMTGPHGFFTLTEDHHGDIVFAATGTGIAPVLSMLHELSGPTQPDRTKVGRRHVWWGVRAEDDLFLRDEVTRACRRGGAELHLFLSRPSDDWSHGRGRITQAVLEATPSLATPMFYVVGNGAMIRELKAGLVKLGIDRKKQIRTEAFFD